MMMAEGRSPPAVSGQWASQGLPLLCIMGPTASGKTAMAMRLYDRLPVELISVDSAMVYAGMDIGTAKPEPKELARYPHHLIDICDPAVAYSAARFVTDASGLIDAIRARGNVPVLIGGSMLYYRALLIGLDDLPAADPVLREHLRQEYAQRGAAVMHQRLMRVDPDSAQRLHQNDQQRVLRALEVFEVTGSPLSQLQRGGRGLDNITPHIAVALQPIAVQTLRERIAVRFDEMLERGLEEEVRQFYQRGDLTADLPSMRAVGYRQMWQYLDGELDFEAMRFRAIAATCQLAKRQRTWLRKWPNLHTFDGDRPDVAGEIENLLNSCV